jgi:hypothetical protein
LGRDQEKLTELQGRTLLDMLSLVAIETGGDVTVVADVRGLIPESAFPESAGSTGAP